MKRTLATALATTAIGLSFYLAAPQPAAAQDFLVPPNDPPPPARGIRGAPLPGGVPRVNGNAPPQFRRQLIQPDWRFRIGWGRTFVIPRRVVVTPSPTYIVPTDLPANFLPTLSADDPGVALLNPKQNAGPVSYTLNAIRYTMQPGYEQKLPAGRSWTLEFDRGGSFGTARYSLTPGTYAFAMTERGWDVFRRTDPLPSDVPSAPAPALAQASQ